MAHSTLTGRATLLFEASLGGRAFLNALPSGRTRIEPAAFVCELRARLQVPEAEGDVWCPLCDAILDCHSYHAGMCVVGGERTQRHHAVRDLVFAWARRGGFRPELERSGLLLPCSPDDATNTAQRRPADVYLPAFAGSPTALDFAITAPQRQETLALARRCAGAAAEAYAMHKATHLQTHQVCQAQGVVFTPMVAESTGAWDAAALKVLKNISHALATHAGEEPAACYNRFLQELGVTIRAFRARAALRRRSEA